jgi:hypothetical protein
MSSGNYRVSLVNNEKVLETKTIQVFEKYQPTHKDLLEGIVLESCLDR